MVTRVIKKVFGDPNERALKKHLYAVEKINALESDLERLSDEELLGKTAEFKARLAEDEPLGDILPEAFATAREAAKRAIGQRHYDVQLLGGVVLHSGAVAEMKTGEGKTLVATLPVYLNALEGKGIHLVTVNDYLAKRDTQWMGPIYHLLGLTVSCLQHDTAYMFDPEVTDAPVGMEHLRSINRREAYAADITHGTNNEFGFDYLRDNMAIEEAQKVQRPLHFSIVDEVDNILIDEARTPLIISGAARESTDEYKKMARLVPRLTPEEDFIVEERERTVILTDEGISKMERWLNVGNLYDPVNYGLTHYVENALRAQVLYLKDHDYVAKDGEVIIVDEFTGRLMPGRRYAEGLHQAIEAKEGLEVRQESITYATITLQNYFRLYSKLAGMTGTAATEAEELYKVYKLDVLVIPTHRPMIRDDRTELVYKNERAKFAAVVDHIQQLHTENRPVLVGTTSIETSEQLSDMLKRRGVRHQVLNAKQHEREAPIIAQAGRLGAITVATNMAGRGTDIVLGGSPADRDHKEWQDEHDKVVELGGLFILGTERHEARRIDNQLRGRGGRQGDPGASRFYVSLEDNLMRRFGGERIQKFMDMVGMDDDVPLENDRDKTLAGDDLTANVRDFIQQEIRTLVASHTSSQDRAKWTVDALEADLLTIMPLPDDLTQEYMVEMEPEGLEEALQTHADSLYEKREEEIGTDRMRVIERVVMLRIIDSNWVEHVTAMQNLRQGIGLQAYGQRDPLVMYKMDAHRLFGELLNRIQHDIVHTIYHVAPAQSGTVNPAGSAPRRASRGAATATATRPGVAAGASEVRATNAGSGMKKVGRNDPCPCGSGKKYKRCHAATAAA
jgi:preprotein translocase subunit SecA